MIGVILAAGYGTRLGELGARLPKALLPVGRTCVIDLLLERLLRVGIRRAVMVTNARFEEAFRLWREAGGHALMPELLCDGSSEPDNRLGAVRDLALALERVPGEEPVFVTASDNLYTADFHGLVARFEETGAPVVAAIKEDDEGKLRRSGVMTFSADDGRMLAFVEKPEEPPSPYAAPPLYLYPPDIRSDIDAFLADPDLDHDAPGNLVAFLLKRRSVYAVVLEGKRYDIGSLEVYEEVSRVFGSAEG